MISFDEVVSEEYTPLDQPIRIGRYKLGPIIGKGTSSIVRKSVRDGDNKIFAVKELHNLTGHQGTLIQLQFQQEVQALRKISHCHVIKMHECFQTQRRFYIVLDFVAGILLSSHVSERHGLPENEALLFSSQLTSALVILHKADVIHRDIKPANVMLDRQNMKVTIIDFGLSASLPGHMARRCGTPAYMAPEVTSTLGYGAMVDMWSLGVSIVEMLMGAPPNLNGLHGGGNYPKLVQRRELFASLPSLSKECIGFLDRLLQIHPERRITSTEALQHNWIKSAKDVTVNNPSSFSTLVS